MKLKDILSLLGAVLLAVSVSGCGNAGEKNSTQDNPTDRTAKVNLTIHLDGEKEPVAATLYRGDGYSIYIPDSGFRYERNFDDGVYEEHWESVPDDDAEVMVWLYKNTTEQVARSAFLRENDDYIFEDLTGEPFVGTELDGDKLWFKVVPHGADTYIVSWKYSERTKESLSETLAQIAGTFKVNE